MLRHSISQVFGSKHPALSPRENDGIGRPPWLSLNTTASQLSVQQPHRESGSTFLDISSLNPSSQPSYSQEPIVMSMPMPTSVPAPAVQPLPLPGHMPQSFATSMPSPSTLTTVMMDASSLHPVFFTERLRKSPFVVDGVEVTSPVAYGYGYRETQRRIDGAVPSML
ncbi:uncharacterized protein F4812DRAFT_274356 [Daldinia caldariorum]|uniref:uncharacterized protein n=1 Tax=Daldinia caldariorum TaxID=326644 RepID=UPI0020076517|nr:uncharacterized protein F4812DRAFT_274356 [Daldinia caldariorum]KAI1470667.1 hypothetical protein F4812DRAFT_274356 [Daldinia caldariorum]